MEIAFNKKASFSFEILEHFSAGVVLLGHEVKSLKTKKPSLDGVFISVTEEEVWINKLQITPYQAANIHEKYDPYRKRKLLLQKKEIKRLIGTLSQKGLTLIPLSVYTTRGRIKISFALVKQKKKHDKRNDIKQRDLDRDMARDLKVR